MHLLNLKRSLVLLLSLLIVTACLRIGSAQADEPPYYAITNARVVTVTGSVIENGTVVISDGLIAAVGTDVAVPPEALVIDGKGLTVYPGMIDAFTDIGLQSSTSSLNASIGLSRESGTTQQRTATTVRGPQDRPATTPWLVAADEIKTDDKRIETWRQGGFTTALSVPKVGIFPGQGSLINLAGNNPSEMVIKSPVNLQINFQAGSGFGSFPSSLMGVISYIRQVILDTRHYSTAISSYTSNPKGMKRPIYDRTVQTLHKVFESGLLVTMPAVTATDIHRTSRLAEELNLHPLIVGAHEGYKVAEMLASRKIPVFVSTKWPERDRNADPEAEESLKVLRLRSLAPSTPAAFVKAGVKFAFYSDGLPSPKDLLKNVRTSIDAGLRPEDALNALTLWPAEILGVADCLGSIEVGKIANLVVTDGDIFSEKTKVKMVFVDGRRFEVRESERPKEAPTTNLTGKWNLIVNSPQGQQNITADLQMAPDGTLSGTLTSMLGSSSLSEGYVSGKKFNFKTSITLGARSLSVSFSGSVEEKEMRGTVSFESVTAEFTGTRPEAE